MSVTRGKSTLERSQDIQRQERAAAVLELAQQNMPAQAIAERFGVSRTTVDRDLRETLERIAEERHALGDLVYDDHLRLIDSMALALRARAFNADMTTVTDLEAVKELRAVLDQRAKLLGLYPVLQQSVSAQVVNHYTLNFGGSVKPAGEVTMITGHAQPTEGDSSEDSQQDSA